MITNKFIQINLIFLFCILFMFSGCLSFEHIDKAMSDINKNDYYNAVHNLINALAEFKRNKKAIELLNYSYPKAVAVETESIKELKNKKDISWDSIVYHYKRLIGLQDDIISLQNSDYYRRNRDISFSKIDYSEEYKEALNNAAEFHYLEGIEMSGIDDKDIQKKAAFEFNKAMEYIPGYKDSKKLYSEAREKAVKKILLVMDDNAGLSEFGGDFKSRFMSYFFKNYKKNMKGSEFFRVTDIAADPDEIKRQNDEVFYIKMTELDYRQPVTVTDNYIEQKDVVFTVFNIFSNNKDDNDKHKKHDKYDQKNEHESYQNPPQYVTRTVFAEITRFTMNCHIAVKSEYNIEDTVTGKPVMDNDHFTSYDFNYMWADYSGDYNALSYSSIELCRRDKPIAPSQSEMFDIIAARLADEYFNVIFDYYKD